LFPPNRASSLSLNTPSALSSARWILRLLVKGIPVPRYLPFPRDLRLASNGSMPPKHRPPLLFRPSTRIPPTAITMSGPNRCLLLRSYLSATMALPGNRRCGRVKRLFLFCLTGVGCWLFGRCGFFFFFFSTSIVQFLL